MSASVRAMPGGQPSITQPMAGPWDSPKLVTVKSVPKVLPLMDGDYPIPPKTRAQSLTVSDSDCVPSGQSRM